MTIIMDSPTTRPMNPFKCNISSPVQIRNILLVTCHLPPSEPPISGTCFICGSEECVGLGIGIVVVICGENFHIFYYRRRIAIPNTYNFCDRDTLTCGWGGTSKIISSKRILRYSTTQAAPFFYVHRKRSIAAVMDEGKDEAVRGEPAVS